MRISSQPNTPRIANQNRPQPSGPPPQSPDPNDGYVPGATGAEHIKRERCQRAIGTLSGGVGGAGLATLGGFLGSTVGHPVLGGIAGAVLGAVGGYKLGFAQAARLHDNSGAEPLTHWQDPPRTSDDQAKEFQQGITELQNKLVDSGKNGKIERGFHMKQNWAGKAHLDFRPDLDPSLRAELLSNVAGREIPVAVRFSNGQGCPFKDGKPDVRGVALKLDVDGQEGDMLATNHVTFAHDAEQFMKFASISAVMQADGPVAALKALGHKIRHEGYRLGESARILYNIVCDTAPQNKHVASETYWTQAMHVGNLTGRFVFEPESGAVTKPGRFGAGENYLRTGMETDLSNGPVKMHVGFEAFTEDSPATDAHQHGEFKKYDVGTLVFDQRAASSEERTFEEDTVAAMAFNPTHGFTLAGPMNESNRGKIYAQSAANRGAIDFTAEPVQKFFADKTV